MANFDVAARVLREGAAVEPASGTDIDAAAQALEGDTGRETKTAIGGGIVGHSAFDSDVHKALEGACHTLAQVRDPGLRSRVEGILDRILAAQAKDGYLVSYYLAKEPENRWANLRHSHEMYNAGHLFEFAVAHHLLDGETKALDAARRFADHIDGVFGPSRRYDVDGHQEVELALVKLYRVTGEKRYLDLCRFFLEERGHAHGTERKPFTEVLPRGNPPRRPGQTQQEYMRAKWGMRNGRMQDHKPVLQQTEAVGHAVRAGYMYAAMADLARFSDAPEYTDVLRQLWRDVVHRKMYITGGVGTAQYGDEGFGDPYRLPNKTYCESCSSIAQILWQHRMSLLEADARHADVLELVLYNAALSGLSLSGDRFFYQNPLMSEQGTGRSEWIGLACCPTNYARFIPQVGGFAYAKTDGKILVNLYASGEARIPLAGAGTVEIRQQTRYPWDGKIQLAPSLDAPAAFTLCLRIPRWALGHPLPGDLYHFADRREEARITLTVNGGAVDATPAGDGYVHLSRTWKTGDLVELDLPMLPRRVHANEQVEENRGRVALMRGPVVYCFEGVDQPPGVDLLQVRLPPDAEWTATHRPELLDGVTVLTAPACDARGQPVQLAAIPYFAWANRDRSPMNVWMLEARDDGRPHADSAR